MVITTKYSEVNKIKYLMEYDTSKTLFENTTPQYSQEQLNAAKKKITTERQKNAQLIYNELKKAFDRDNDGDLTDWDNTDETGALRAINKIKYREELDHIEYLVKKQGQYKSLRAWLNSEMSDWDSEYGDIWNKLQGLGYLGRNTNYLYQVAGTMFKYSLVGVLANLGENVINEVRNWSLDDWIEAFRGFLGGVAGGVAQAVLASFAPIGNAINLGMNAFLFICDWIQKAMNSANFSWFNVILDAFGTILGVLGLRAALKPVQAAASALKKVSSLDELLRAANSKFPAIIDFFKKYAGKLIGYGGKFVTLINDFLTWLVSKVPFISKMIETIKPWVGKVGGYLKQVSDSILSVIGTTAKNVGSNIAKAISKSICANGKCLQNYGKTVINSIYGALSKSAFYAGYEQAEKELFKWVIETIGTYGTSKVEDVRPYFCDASYANWRKTEASKRKIPENLMCNAFDLSLEVMVGTVKAGSIAAGGGLKSPKDLTSGAEAVKDVTDVTKTTTEKSQELSSTK